MSQKHLWGSLLIGVSLLVGTSSAFAALWDKPCQEAIDDVQQLQKDITLKKQEMDAARVVGAIPANFVAAEFQGQLQSSNREQSLKELEALFQNMKFAVAEFSSSCLKNNEVAE